MQAKHNAVSTEQHWLYGFKSFHLLILIQFISYVIYVILAAFNKPDYKN